MIQSSLAFDLRSCRVHDHHPLNLSDQYPYLTFATVARESDQPQPQGVNWFKAVEWGGYCFHSSVVSTIVSPLILYSHQSESELNDEINFVC